MHGTDEERFGELASGNVHADPLMCSTELLPHTRLSARGTHDPITDGDDEARLLCDRNEAHGGDLSHPGMLPAEQRLEPKDGVCRHLDDRLIDETKLMILDRSLEVFRQFGPLLHGLVHARLEEGVATLARILRGVHRDIRVSHQL